MDSQKYPIAILDSGVGGLSIFHSVRKLLPNHSIVYACDNKNFPYGPKSQELVTQCISELTQKVIDQFSPSLIVIACNTASTIALETLRAKSKIPVVGVVPAIKPAASITQTKVIGLLATPGTINREYTDKLISQHASQMTVLKVGSKLIVEMAENKLRGKECDLQALKEELAPFFPRGSESPIDTIVLGCTHFPLLLEELQKVVPKKLNWVDSSEAIAQRVKSFQEIPKSHSVNYTAVFTELNSSAKELDKYLQSLNFSKVTELK